jgi:ribonucleotide reductase beta subunit family protein with ferritin-like domain
MANFQRETSFLKDAAHFYAMQGANEVIHNETYSICLQTFVRDPAEQARGLNAIANFPQIRNIADWAFKWMDSSIPLLERVIAFACIEGIIFSSPFAGVFHLKRLNKFKGLTQANEWISRDEALHTQFAIDLYHILSNKEAMKPYNKYFEPVTTERAHLIVQSAYDVCEKFTREAMNVDLVGLNVQDMVDYVSVTADWVLKAFGFPKIFNRENPLTWMAIISVSNKSNFFEKIVSEYARPAEGKYEYDTDINF